LTVSSFPSIKGKGEEVTRVFYGVETVINTVLQFLNQTNDIIYACVDQTRPVLTIDIPELRQAFLNAKNRGVKLRYITEITKDNISYCQQLLTMVDELRHLDGIKGNFYISERGYLAPATFHEKGKPASQIIYSNVMELIEHQNYVFESFWNKSVPAEQKIREIEEGIESEFFEVITDHQKASEVLLDLSKSVKKEALLFLPNDKSMVRMERLEVIECLIKASQNGATIKIICPISEENTGIIRKISKKAPNIRILNGNNSPYGMYVVDGEKFLRAELGNPNAEKFSEAIGFTIYSNRKITAGSFKSVFELLWNERTLNEELRRADNMQKEFINVAAHELRTPIQPILGLSEFLQSKLNDKEQQDLIDVISRNAKRLQRLTDEILDVTKIESQSLQLKKEKFNLNEVIVNVLVDYGSQIKKINGIELSVINRGDFFIEADKVRLNQVISNLLDNAIKFTEKGSIIISSERKDDNVIVSIKDTGTGIDHEIMPRLFSKFTARPFSGTGLGLYISKSIIEAHGGRIWAENNPDGKGATFVFSLPFSTNR
jgi:two-component system sensor histidine kinase VicK